MKVTVTLDIVRGDLIDLLASQIDLFGDKHLTNRSRVLEAVKSAVRQYGYQGIELGGVLEGKPATAHCYVEARRLLDLYFPNAR